MPATSRTWVAFTVALGGYESGGRYKHGNLQATPIVEDGMMYVTDGWGSVYAIDVTNPKKASIKWKFDPATDRAWAGDVACCGVNNRGVALWKDKIISISLDGRLFSLNKATGEMVWERKVADPAFAETLTLAPLVIRDIGIIGVAGGEYGVRGWIDGTDLNTGKQVWRTYDPGTGRARHETWKDGKERYKHGGGSVWETATYDPETDTFYQGIGNAGPDWDPEYRPGDNKWAASVLALNPADGKIKWGYQYTPNDPYDFDEISEHQIINAKINGEDRKLVVHAARNGFYYALDRTNGSFILGKQYVDQLNWTPGLDPTGRRSTTIPIPTSRNTHRAAIARAPSRRATACARRTTAAWEPGAYNPELGLLYIPSIEGCNTVETVEQKDFEDQGGPVKWRERFAGGGQADRAALRQHQGARSDHRRNQGQAEARISELQRRSRPPATWCSWATTTAVRGLRRQEPAGALELQHRHRHQRAGRHLRGQRQAIRRRSGGVAPAAERLVARARAQAHGDGVHALCVRAAIADTRQYAPARSRAGVHHDA